MQKKHIAIVGGGANGVAAFIELVIQLNNSNLQQKVKISIIEKDVIGEGLAFGTKQPSHLLNTQANLMGIHTHEQGHYSEWLQANRHIVDDKEVKSFNDPEDAYTTRRLYSYYLQDKFKEYVDHAAMTNLETKFIYAEVINIVPGDKDYNILMNDANSLKADYVILAPGTPKPNKYEEFEKFNEYIDFPWPSKPLLEIPSNATVGILGTSLSAVDAVMTLMDNDHLGTIKLFSPDGLLPRVQPKSETNYTCKRLTLAQVHKIKRTHLRPPKVKELFRLFKEEVKLYSGEDIDWKKTKRKGRSAQALLEEDIEIAKSGGDAFINILYASRYDASPIWLWLSTEERKRFKHWIGTEWTATRHAMPMHNANKLRRLFNEGRLKVYGDLKDVRRNNSSNEFIIQHNDENEQAQYLINATGAGNKVKEMKSSLIQNLSSSGVIEPYEVGGILINPQTMQVVSAKKNTQNLYAVGHICNGLLLDVNSVWFNVRTIANMAQHIINSITGGYPS